MFEKCLTAIKFNNNLVGNRNKSNATKEENKVQQTILTSILNNLHKSHIEIRTSNQTEEDLSFHLHNNEWLKTNSTHLFHLNFKLSFNQIVAEPLKLKNFKFKATNVIFF